MEIIKFLEMYENENIKTGDATKLVFWGKFIALKCLF